MVISRCTAPGSWCMTNKSGRSHRASPRCVVLSSDDRIPSHGPVCSDYLFQLFYKPQWPSVDCSTVVQSSQPDGSITTKQLLPQCSIAADRHKHQTHRHFVQCITATPEQAVSYHPGSYSCLQPLVTRGWISVRRSVGVTSEVCLHDQHHTAVASDSLQAV